MNKKNVKDVFYIYEIQNMFQRRNFSCFPCLAFFMLSGKCYFYCQKIPKSKPVPRSPEEPSKKILVETRTDGRPADCDTTTIGDYRRMCVVTSGSGVRVAAACIDARTSERSSSDD